MVGPFTSPENPARWLPPWLSIAVLAGALLGAPPPGASAQPPVVTIATVACASRTPGIQVGDTCYPAPALPQPQFGTSAVGGLQVLGTGSGKCSP